MIAARIIDGLIGLFGARRRRAPRLLAPERLRAELSRAEAPLVLDVRNADEFVGDLGHIEGAVLMPLPELEQKLDELTVHRRRRIVAV